MEIHLWGVPVQLVHRGPSDISSWNGKICLLKSRAIEKGGRLKSPKKSLWDKASQHTGDQNMLEPGEQKQSRENTDKNSD